MPSIRTQLQNAASLCQKDAKTAIPLSETLALMKIPF